MTMTSSQEPLKLLLKRPVTRQIGEAALHHGLGQANAWWTLCIHGLLSKRRYQLFICSFTYLSPSITHGSSQVWSTDLFASSKFHRCHQNISSDKICGVNYQPKRKKTPKVSWIFMTFPNLSQAFWGSLLTATVASRPRKERCSNCGWSLSNRESFTTKS